MGYRLPEGIEREGRKLVDIPLGRVRKLTGAEATAMDRVAGDGNRQLDSSSPLLVDLVLDGWLERPPSLANTLAIGVSMLSGRVGEVVRLMRLRQTRYAVSGTTLPNLILGVTWRMVRHYRRVLLLAMFPALVAASIIWGLSVLLAVNLALLPIAILMGFSSHEAGHLWALRRHARADTGVLILGGSYMAIRRPEVGQEAARAVAAAGPATAVAIGVALSAVSVVGGLFLWPVAVAFLIHALSFSPLAVDGKKIWGLPGGEALADGGRTE